MPFDPKKCEIPTVWCGKKQKPGVVLGDRYQCMRKGFGAGMYSEIKKLLPKDSLRHIKYVGEYYEDRFKRIGIRNINELVYRLRSMSATQIRNLLLGVFTNKGGKYDYRSFNSTLMYLYTKKVVDLPSCVEIKL